MYPDDRKYSKDHEWVLVNGDEAAIGITQYAQEAMGDVVYVELPSEDDHLKAGESIGVIESVKAVSDVFCPVDGQVIAVNEGLIDTPELINEDPHDKGWLIRIKLTDSSQLNSLMTNDEYEAFVQGL